MELQAEEVGVLEAETTEAQIPTGDDAQNDEETEDTNYDTGSEHNDAEIYTAECRVQRK